MEPPVGYDPTTSRWQREILPLNYRGQFLSTNQTIAAFSLVGHLGVEPRSLSF